MVDGTQQHTVLVDGQRSAQNGGRDLMPCAQVRHAGPPHAGVSIDFHFAFSLFPPLLPVATCAVQRAATARGCCVARFAPPP